MLGLVLGLAGSSRRSDVSATAQLFGAEIQGQCPAGCATPISILGVRNLGRGAGDGHRIEVKWTVGNPPAGFQLASNVVVGVEATLPDGKVRKGSGTSGSSTSLSLRQTAGQATPHLKASG